MSNSIYCSSPVQDTVVKLMLNLQFQIWDYEEYYKISKCSQNPTKIKEPVTDTGLCYVKEVITAGAPRQLQAGHWSQKNQLLPVSLNLGAEILPFGTLTGLGT